MAHTIYLDALAELNDGLAAFNLEAVKIRGINVGTDRWSQFITTGKERDLTGQRGCITFCRKISEEIELNFDIYFPRFAYGACQSKTLYYVANGRRIFDGMGRKRRDESVVGWVLSREERAHFTKWYNTVTIRNNAM